MASKKTDKSGKTPKHGMDKERANKEVGYMRSAATVCARCLRASNGHLELQRGGNATRHVT